MRLPASRLCLQRWLLVAKRTCKFVKENGDPCGAPPRQQSDFCIVHDPEYASEMTEARRLGGLRRRREKTLAIAYDIEDSLDSIPKIRRLVEIAAFDTVGLENSTSRSRTLIAAAMAAAKLLEIGNLEERLAALEAALGPRLAAKRR